jgi:hypothetical protein
MLDQGGPKEGRPRDRYHAEYVRVSEGTDPQAQLQDILAGAEAKECNLLVGVAGGLPDGGMVLFWDTQKPSFGRTDSV